MVAKFTFEISPNFLKQLGSLANIDIVAPQMIDESIPILKSSVKAEVGRHKLTGSMLASIKQTKAKGSNNGFYAVVRPTGKDANGVRNMAKLAYLEYGTSKQTPKPVLTKAIKDAENPVMKKMQEVFNREMSR